MKKVYIFFLMLTFCFFKPFTSNANSNLFSLWENEDEEANMKGNKTKQDTQVYQQVSPSSNNKSGVKQTIQAKSKTQPNSTQPVIVQQQNNNITYSQPIQQNNNIIYATPKKNNTIVLEDLTNDNYDIIDYDTIQSERAITESEIMNSVDKWQEGVKNVYWENYRGNNVRVEMLRNNRDLKEMRLKFVQSQDMISDPDGSISDMLNKVAEQVMKRTCGKKAKQSIILYERPSVELVQETSYDNYKIIAKGSSLKEYGFRCIY